MDVARNPRGWRHSSAGAQSPKGNRSVQYRVLKTLPTHVARRFLSKPVCANNCYLRRRMINFVTHS